MEFTND
jgi:hypothetical protein